MLFSIIGYHLSRHRRIYRYLAKVYNTSRYRVYALSRGRKVRKATDYLIVSELERRRLML
jgi:hypothetical protein